MISVIIPMYNRLSVTLRAIQSVLDQTYTDLEVLVVDDASTTEIFTPGPETDPRVRIVRHETNRGLAAARNTGVEAARGEVVAFLDSDDYWFTDKLEKQWALYEQQGHRDQVLIYSAYYYEMNGKWVTEPRTFWKEGKPLSDYFFIECGDIHGSTWLGRRTFFQKFPSCPAMKRHQDWDMLLQMAAAGVLFVGCPEPLGVRTADLRSDRISTLPVPEMRALFLERNVSRMTPGSGVLFEAANISACHPHWSFLWRQYQHVRYFLSTPKLGISQKTRLIIRYAWARLLKKIHVLLWSRKAKNPQE